MWPRPPSKPIYLRTVVIKQINRTEHATLVEDYASALGFWSCEVQVKSKVVSVREVVYLVQHNSYVVK